MHPRFPKEEAELFFAELFGGYHHIPGKQKVRDWGAGWFVAGRRCMATYDNDLLTRFVLMCHRDCVRGEIDAHGLGAVKLIIHKRAGREGRYSERHPDIMTAIDRFSPNPHPHAPQP